MLYLGPAWAGGSEAEAVQGAFTRKGFVSCAKPLRNISLTVGCQHLGDSRT